MSYEPLSPLDVEQRLRQLVTEMTRAEKELRTARDNETGAEIAYKKKQRKTLLSPECPKVTRGGYTVTERDAWVEEQCGTEWERYRIAQSEFQDALNHVFTVRDIATSVQSLGSLVRTAYSVAGVS